MQKSNGTGDLRANAAVQKGVCQTNTCALKQRFCKKSKKPISQNPNNTNRNQPKDKSPGALEGTDARTVRSNAASAGRIAIGPAHRQVPEPPEELGGPPGSAGSAQPEKVMSVRSELQSGHLSRHSVEKSSVPTAPLAGQGPSSPRDCTREVHCQRAHLGGQNVSL